MPDIIFVNPNLTLEERYGKLAAAGSLEPPHGLCNLAAVCIKENIDVEILDIPALGLTYEQALNHIIKKSPKYVGITAVTISIYNAAKLAKMIKEVDNNIVIIIGGPHLTAVPEETMSKFPEFDIGVIGEGEITIIELIKTLEKKEPLEKVNGIIFRKSGQLHTTGKRELIKNLDELPFPAWHLLPDMKNYPPAVASCKRLPSTSIITTRGCTGKCTFCDRSGFGETVRAYSAEYIIEMITFLQKKYHIKDIRIMDDNFILIRSRLKKVSELIKKQKINITWSCLARVDMVDSDILKIIKEAGCWQIAYGIESGSQEILELLNKNITLEQIRRAIMLTKEAKIKTLGYFMLGNPKETENSIEQSIKLIEKLDFDDVKITFFTPYPGSKIFSTAKQYGFFNDDWKSLDCNLDPVFIPENLTKEYLVKIQRKILRKFYLRPRIILSYLKKISNIKQIPALYLATRGFFKHTFSKCN
ncbi:MAG: radical SAM protein [Elusimicrobia bacterium]|nr:radical SAM protein [Elusimicrobiota bacterium]